MTCRSSSTTQGGGRASDPGACNGQEIDYSLIDLREVEELKPALHRDLSALDDLLRQGYEALERVLTGPREVVDGRPSRDQLLRTRRTVH